LARRHIVDKDYKVIVNGGDKVEGYRKFGEYLYADDIDFAHRAVETCVTFKPEKCIILVKDDDVMKFIDRFIYKRLHTLRKNNIKVYVIKVPFTYRGDPEDLKRKIVSMIYYTDIEDTANTLDKTNNTKWNITNKIADIYTEIRMQ